MTKTARTKKGLPTAYLEMELLCRYFEGYFLATQMAHTNDNGMVIYLTRNLDEANQEIYVTAKKFRDALRPSEAGLFENVELLMEVFSRGRLMLHEHSAAAEAMRIGHLFKAIADAIKLVRKGGAALTTKESKPQNSTGVNHGNKR